MAEAQTHVEVEPVALGWINTHIDVEAVFSHVDRTHIIRNIPHEAIDTFGIDNRVQECGNAPRRQAPRCRRCAPQGGVQPVSPRLDATHYLGHGLVAQAVGHRSARARLTLAILGPPAHHDRFPVATHRAHKGHVRASLRVKTPIGGRHRKTPEEGGQPRATKLCDIVNRNVQAAVERKAIKCSQPLDARDHEPSIQQEHACIAVDTRPCDHLVSVARDNPDVKAVRT